MSAMHLYAIIPTGDEVVFDVTGVDGDNNVCSIPCGGISAVVGPSPPVDYRGLAREQAVRYLVAHQRVIENVMRSFSVLPVKFGTSASDKTEVRRLLEQGEPLFRAAQEKLNGHVQMEVVVLWDLQMALRDVREEASIVQAKSQLMAGAKTTTITETDRIALGRLVQASLERHRAELRDRVMLPSLSDAAADVIANPIMDDSMVTNLAFLVDEAGRVALERRLDVLSQEFEGRLSFRLVGPLPPYSFATVEVEAPSFDAVDEARRLLGLGETASAEDIKLAYHALARKFHPDHDPNDAEATLRMAGLNYAYKLLTKYAAGASQKTKDATCRFDRHTVESTLLVAVKRQEAVADW